MRRLLIPRHAGPTKKYCRDAFIITQTQKWDGIWKGRHRRTQNFNIFWVHETTNKKFGLGFSLLKWKNIRKLTHQFAAYAELCVQNHYAEFHILLFRSTGGNWGLVIKMTEGEIYRWFYSHPAGENQFIPQNLSKKFFCREFWLWNVLSKLTGFYAGCVDTRDWLENHMDPSKSREKENPAKNAVKIFSNLSIGFIITSATGLWFFLFFSFLFGFKSGSEKFFKPSIMIKGRVQHSPVGTRAYIWKKLSYSRFPLGLGLVRLSPQVMQ